MTAGSGRDPWLSSWRPRKKRYEYVHRMSTKAGQILKVVVTWLPGEDPTEKLEAAHKDLITRVRAANEASRA
jgi:hypothetical protein